MNRQQKISRGRANLLERKIVLTPKIEDPKPIVEVPKVKDPKPTISFCFNVKNRLEMDRTGGEILPLFKNSILTLKNQLECLNILNKCEVIISCWDDNEFIRLKKFMESNFKLEFFKIIKVNKKTKFSRGLGRNLAGKKALKKIIAFIDADMIFIRSCVITRGIDICLNSNHTSVYFPICYSLKPDGTGEWRPSGKGNCFIPKHIFSEIKWLEREEWGYEDEKFFEDVGYKVHDGSNIKIIRDECPGWYHQWHEYENN